MTTREPGLTTYPTLLICPGEPGEISRMMAAAPSLEARCRVVWWGRNAKIGAKIRAGLPDACIVVGQVSPRGVLNQRVWESAPFADWCHQALRYDEILAARQQKPLDDAAFSLAAAQVAEAVRVLSLIRPDVVLIKAATRLHEAAFSAVARSLGLPCFTFERGAFPESLFLDSTTVGPEMLRPAHEIPSAIEVEAAEDYLTEFQGSAQSAWGQPDRKSEAQLRRELQLRSDTRLFFYAAQVEKDANMVLYSPHFSSNSAFLEFVLAALPDDANTVLVAKPHPKEKAELRAKNGGKRRLIISRDLNIKDILPLAEAVLTLNSTSGFEALLLGRPVVCGARAYYSHRGWTFDVDSPRDGARLGDFLRQPQFSAPQQAAFRVFSHQLIAHNLFFQTPAPGLNGPTEFVQRLLNAATATKPDVEPSLIAGAEAVLAEASRLGEAPSQAQLWRELWRRLRRSRA